MNESILIPTEKLIEHLRAAATVIERSGANKPLVDLLTAAATRLGHNDYEVGARLRDEVDRLQRERDAIELELIQKHE